MLAAKTIEKVGHLLLLVLLLLLLLLLLLPLLLLVLLDAPGCLLLGAAAGVLAPELASWLSE